MLASIKYMYVTVKERAAADFRHRRHGTLVELNPFCTTGILNRHLSVLTARHGACAGAPLAPRLVSADDVLDRSSDVEPDDVVSLVLWHLVEI